MPDADLDADLDRALGTTAPSTATLERQPGPAGETFADPFRGTADALDSDVVSDTSSGARGSVSAQPPADPAGRPDRL
jgi:hypothetical protein